MKQNLHTPLYNMNIFLENPLMINTLVLQLYLHVVTLKSNIQGLHKIILHLSPFPQQLVLNTSPYIVNMLSQCKISLIRHYQMIIIMKLFYPLVLPLSQLISLILYNQAQTLSIQIFVMYYYTIIPFIHMTCPTKHLRKVQLLYPNTYLSPQNLYRPHFIANPLILHFLSTITLC